MILISLFELLKDYELEISRLDLSTLVNGPSVTSANYSLKLIT